MPCSTSAWWVHNNGQRYIYTMVDEIEALKKVTPHGVMDEVGHRTA